MDFLIDVISRLPEYKTLKAAAVKGRPAAAAGLTAVHKANVVTALCSQLGRKALILVGEEQEGQQLANNIASMGLRALFYPLRDLNFLEVSGQSREYEHKRLLVLSSILKNDYDVVIATVDAASQFTIPPEELRRRCLHIAGGEETSIEELTTFLVSSGYERCDAVEGEGQFSVRGGILDMFMPDAKAPIRIEFWGDEIDTINFFDVETQRRGDDYVEDIDLSPSTEVLISNKAELAEKIRKKARSLRSKNAAAARAKLEAEAQRLDEGDNLGSADKFISLIYDRQTSLFDYFGADSLLFVSEHTRVKATPGSSAKI